MMVKRVKKGSDDEVDEVRYTVKKANRQNMEIQGQGVNCLISLIDLAQEIPCGTSTSHLKSKRPFLQTCRYDLLRAAIMI